MVCGRPASGAGWALAGEESAGLVVSASRRLAYGPRTKTASLPCLLSAEITARTGTRPGRNLPRTHPRTGRPGLRAHRRACHAGTKGRVWRNCRRRRQLTEMAGEKIQQILTTAPGNGSPIGGIKVIAEHGWFAARPSGTEDIYKIYAESFRRKRPPAANSERKLRHIVADTLARSARCSRQLSCGRD